jgi:hypothetical protein
MHGLLSKSMQLPMVGCCCLGCGSLYAPVHFLGVRCSVWARVGGLIIVGTLPGVLFCVTRWCKHGVSLRVCFAVGFLACRIGGAFVMRGTSWTVMMGVLSITLCCCIRITLSLTLCSFNAFVGFKIFLMFAWRSLMRWRPFCVALVIAVKSVNSSVSARKCWCSIRFGSWQCCGNSLVDPEIGHAHVLGIKYQSHW